MHVRSPIGTLKATAGALPGWLPRGRTLSDDAWAKRHLWMLGLLCAHALGIFGFALLQGVGLVHALTEGGAVGFFAVVAALRRRDRRLGSGAVALGLLTASAAAVHLSHGAIEAHFHFFVMIAVLTLYEDWLPFLLAVGFVLVHHGLGGVLAPESVYAHGAAQEAPWEWALIHAAFVAGAGAANVLAWRLHEDTRGELRQLATIVETSDDAILSVSRDGTVLSWNAGAQRLFGWQPDEAVGTPLRRLLPEHRTGEERELLRRVLAGEHVEHHESEWCARDGRLVSVRLSASPLREPGGAIAGASAIVHDVTEQRRAAEALQRERRRLTEAEKIGQMGSWEWDRQADHLTWSEQLYRLFAVDPEDFEATSAAYVLLAHPEDRAAVEAHIEDLLATRRFNDLEHRIVRPDGEVRHVLVRGDVVVDDAGEVGRAIGTAIDITERKQSEEAVRRSEQALAHQALHDALTGLPNRTLLENRLEHALHRCSRDDGRVALLFLDVDRFKLVNDSLGHAAGDELLILLAARLDESLRPADTLARFGGDELAILCEGLGAERDGIAVAERVIEALARPFALAGRDVFATASIGVAISGPEDTPDSLLRDADVAMYRAKERGGGRFEVFDAEMRRRTIERMQVETELRRALRDDELRLHYQPVIALENEGLIGAEALVRWEHPERGLLGPVDFIPLAEESSLIIELGSWVLRTACRRIAAWEAGLPEDFALAVNVSGRQLADPQFIDTVRAALADSGADPRRLSLELTESVLMAQDSARDTLLGLKELGVRVVLDDFGTGYSSLSYLSRFPLDGLKVDRSFIARMQEGSPEQAIVAAVATMAHALKLELVAEGIEQDDQVSTLRRLGYRRGQGFLFSRPVPENGFLTLLADGAWRAVLSD